MLIISDSDAVTGDLGAALQSEFPAWTVLKPEPDTEGIRITA